MIPEYEIFKYSKDNEHKFKQHIIDLKLKDMDITEIELMGSNKDNIINDILNFKSENIFLIFMNKYGLVSIIGSKELNELSCYIWMVTSKDIYKKSYKFAKYTYDFILKFQQTYDYLYTYKYINDKKGLKWLKYNGFIEEDKLYFNNKFKLMVNKKIQRI